MEGNSYTDDIIDFSAAPMRLPLRIQGIYTCARDKARGAPISGRREAKGGLLHTEEWTEMAAHLPPIGRKPVIADGGITETMLLLLLLLLLLLPPPLLLKPAFLLLCCELNMAAPLSLDDV